MTSEKINSLFRECGLTLGSVESFTGGLFAKEITYVPGASHFFKGSIVSYATEIKNRVLGISYDIIDEFGVVSKEIASEMAVKGKQLLNVDCCISFTGNAGPSCMEDKPVGEIYIGIAFHNVVHVYAYHLKGNRHNIQEEAILIAYQILEDEISKNFKKN